MSLRTTLGLVTVGALLLGAAGPAAAGASRGGTTGCKRACTVDVAPSLSISSPAEGSTVSGGVVVRGSATDDLGVRSVSVQVDGGAWLPAAGTTSWTADVGGLAPGTHVVSARAADTSGATTSTSTSFAVTPPADTTGPSVSVVSPAAATTVSGTVEVAGTSSDDAAVAAVEVRLDDAAWQPVTGTTSWSWSWPTVQVADGSHTVMARATDTAGNTATTSRTVSVANGVADSTAPTIAISAPSGGSTVSGTVQVSGSAAASRGVRSVDVAVDGGAWQPASGSSSWTWSWATASGADGSHTLTARATDTSGNVATSSTTITVQNTSPTVKEQLVTPEGVTIQVFSDAAGWTAQRVYDLLKPSAYQLDRLGSKLTIKVQTSYASQTSTSASTTNGAYSGFRATMYLKATADSGFTARPEGTLAHEYGHAWTSYHLYLSHQGDWSSYLAARGLTADSRVDSSYNWAKNEMIADDYRVLFGSAAAVSQMTYINNQAPDPRDVAGLRQFLAEQWGP